MTKKTNRAKPTGNKSRSSLAAMFTGTAKPNKIVRKAVGGMVNAPQPQGMPPQRPMMPPQAQGMPPQMPPQGGPPQMPPGLMRGPQGNAMGQQNADWMARRQQLLARMGQGGVRAMADGGAVTKPELTPEQKYQRSINQWQSAFQNWANQGLGQRQTTIFAAFPNIAGMRRPGTNNPPGTGGGLPPVVTPPVVQPPVVLPPTGWGKHSVPTPGTVPIVNQQNAGAFPIYTPPRYPGYATGGLVTRKPKKYI